MTSLEGRARVPCFTVGAFVALAGSLAAGCEEAKELRVPESVRVVEPPDVPDVPDAPAAAPIEPGTDPEPVAPLPVDAAGGVEQAPAEPASYTDPLSAPAVPTLQLSTISGAQECASCHQQYVEEWRGAAHAHSMSDPVYRALIRRQRQALGGPANDLFCTMCHSPLGNRSGDITPGFEFDQLSPKTLEGVSCETCHLTESIERTHNAGIVIEPLGPRRASLPKPSAPHAADYSELFTQAELCGACHDVVTPSGLQLESPYAEWSESPAALAGEPCQSCHMPTYNGRAANIPGSPARQGLHRHRFTGVAPSLSPEVLEDPGLVEQLWEESEALLTGAAGLDLNAEFSDAGDAGAAELAISVTVDNRITGHDFPTGSDFNRQFWLALEVFDADEQLVYSTGQLDPGGDLYDAFHSESDLDPDLVLFSARLMDAERQPTLFTWEAVELQRGSLAPLEARDHVLRFPLPESPEFPFEVRARVRARAFSPRLLRTIGLEELVAQLRIIDVAESDLSVEEPD